MNKRVCILHFHKPKTIIAKEKAERLALRVIFLSPHSPSWSWNDLVKFLFPKKRPFLLTETNCNRRMVSFTVGTVINLCDLSSSLFNSDELTATVYISRALCIYPLQSVSKFHIYRKRERGEVCSATFVSHHEVTQLSSPCSVALLF